MSARLLVASLGNPSPAYTNTLHSAGHEVLSNLRHYLLYPQLSRDRSLGDGLVSRGSLISHGSDYTLWQSPSLMNVSGKAVSTAWKGFLRGLSPDERSTAKLVVIHDDLEGTMGKVKVKIGGSAKGHNGIKSCINSLGGMEFVRIGIGIGRPESRESKDVANYVLRKMTVVETRKVHDGVMDVMRVLTELRDG